jgi:membrane-bound lytic murein transglycosylase D
MQYAVIFLCIFLNLFEKVQILAVSGDAFPVPKDLSGHVLFWEKIFLHHPNHVVFIHDADEPHLIVDTIDFEVWRKHYNLKILPNQATREHVIQSYLKRYQLAISNLQELGQEGGKRGPMEKRIMAVYRKSFKGQHRLKKREITLRVQTGLSESFFKAAERAQDYLPFMEKEFAKLGVPKKLTRLPFIESMFNVNALSSVGASGVWQIMEETGRHYQLIINKVVDERLSPFKATKAAARLLKDNYKILGSWPLAITAYNHGSRGLQKASELLQTKDLGKIVRHYKSPSFQFASKNFYAEFLAAARAYDKLIFSKKLKRRASQFQPHAIQIPGSVSLQDILQTKLFDHETLKLYNPCLKDIMFKNPRISFLPHKYFLFIPTDRATRFLVKITQRVRAQYASRP